MKAQKLFLKGKFKKNITTLITYNILQYLLNNSEISKLFLILPCIIKNKQNIF